MGKIIRDPACFAKKEYDLIIIGGGIYGIMLSYEASKRGLKSLLLEKKDFGSGTTFNFLRILHGGLRYLQTLDLHRFCESVAERKWFLQNFPDFVEPLPCLMPLYGKRLRRPSILKVASFLNDIFSSSRNKDVMPEKHLPNGRIISLEQTVETFPYVDKNGLKGGFVWYDAFMPDSQSFIMAILGRVCELGAFALNYAEAVQLLKDRNDVVGVKVLDRKGGGTYQYKSKIVINAAGPWCRDLAAHFDRDLPELFRPSIAWNVALNINPISSHALAVTPKKPHANTYFLLPWKGKILAGTSHGSWSGGAGNAKPSDGMIQDFLIDLNSTIPGLKVNQNDILHVFAGLLPVKKDGSTNLTVREVILNHADYNGPKGLYSVSGVKFTTARLVAEKTITIIFPKRKKLNENMNERFVLDNFNSIKRGVFEFNWYPSQNDNAWRGALGKIIQDQSVQRLDDLVFRRTTLWENPMRAIKTSPSICELFNWDENHCRNEIDRLKNSF